MPKRKGYTLEFKRFVLDWIYEDEEQPRTSYSAEQHYRALGHDITKQTIHSWLSKPDEISLHSSKKTRRLPGARSKPSLSPKVEDILKEIIMEERLEGNQVKGGYVKQWALELAQEHGVENFNASYGWLEKFMSQNELSLHRVTKH
jgi:hypothetical protein